MTATAARKAVNGFRLAAAVPAGMAAGTLAARAVALTSQLYLPTRITAVCAFCAVYLAALCVYSAVAHGTGDEGTCLTGRLAATGFAGVLCGNLWWAPGACLVAGLSAAAAALTTKGGRKPMLALGVSLAACVLGLGCRQFLTVALPRVMHLGWNESVVGWALTEGVFAAEIAAWAWMRGMLRDW